MSHNLVGVAFLTVPNFPGFINEMYRSTQPLTLIQVLHDVTSAFDHVSGQGDDVINPLSYSILFESVGTELTIALLRRHRLQATQIPADLGSQEPSTPKLFGFNTFRKKHN